MKVPVLISFTDKKTGKPYNCGGVYESNDLKRIKELQEKGFLGGEKVKDMEIETATKPIEAETATKPRTTKKQEV